MNSNLTLFLNFSTFCVQFFGVTTPIYIDFAQKYGFATILDSIFEQAIDDFEKSAYTRYREERQKVLSDRDKRSVGFLFSQEMQNSPHSQQIINASLPEFTNALNVDARERLTEIWLDSAKD